MAWPTRLDPLMVHLDVAGAPHHRTAVDIHPRLNLDVGVDPGHLLEAGEVPIITHRWILTFMILVSRITFKVLQRQILAAEVAEGRIRIGVAGMVAELSCRRFCEHCTMRMGCSNLNRVQILCED